MAKSLELRQRGQSPGEEIANSVSHGIGFLAAVAATPVLVYSAVQNGSAAVIVGVSIFGATMILLYMTSTLYHALPKSKAKRVFKVLDHSAIFLLIAGTYTPFTLGVLRGAWGWTLFGIVWGVAISGVVLKAVGVTGYARLSTVLYVVMGWLIVIAVKPLWLNMPAWGLFWLLAGGIWPERMSSTTSKCSTIDSACTAILVVSAQRPSRQLHCEARQCPETGVSPNGQDQTLKNT